MLNYSKQLPQDKNNAVMTGLAVPFQAQQTTARDNATASSVTGLDPDTTIVEVTAVGVAATIKWAGNQAVSVISLAGTANFDNVVAAGMTRQFVVPRSVMAIANWSGIQNPSVVGLNTAEGLFPAIATKSSGVGSVLLSEF